MYGIFSIGLGMVIITGGIDLSVGSLFALQGVMFGLMLGTAAWPFGEGATTSLPWWLAALLLVAGTMLLGLIHGLLITRAKMQPFIVTLCGLLIYRGAARYFSGDSSIGFGTEDYGMLRWLQAGKLPAIPIPFLILAILVVLVIATLPGLLARRKAGTGLTLGDKFTLGATSALALATIALLIGWLTLDPVGRIGRSAGLEVIFPLLATQKLSLPMPFVLLIIVAVIAGVVLHGSVYGRYLFAVGRNEEATRYSGVNTKRVITSVYVVSAGLAALSGLLFAFYSNAITPSTHGSFYELFGIAAAVLGGCSLRGGEGSILGIVLGAILIQLLQNLVNILGLPSSLNFAVMGVVILLGVLADGLLREKRFAPWDWLTRRFQPKVDREAA